MEVGASGAPNRLATVFESTARLWDSVFLQMLALTEVRRPRILGVVSLKSLSRAPLHPRCYVVLGPFRSGTSLVARVLSRLGADPGPVHQLYEPTDWNPRGYIQRPDVTAFNTGLIVAAGGTLSRPPLPEQIARSSTPEAFGALDLGWMVSAPITLLKDPRFSITLLAWLRHGAFGGRDVRLLRISRGLEANVDSALAHYDVKHYCGKSPETARQVLAAYDEAAAWHLARLPVPGLHLVYEDLVTDTGRQVDRLAAFMGVTDPACLAEARDEVGTGRSRFDALANSQSDN